MKFITSYIFENIYFSKTWILAAVICFCLHDMVLHEVVNLAESTMFL